MPADTAQGPLLGGRYRVIERLGSGGMAAVYLAHDERLDRRVAVKRMHTSGGDEMDARRFEREAKIGASLSHPNLVSIFDSQQDGESVLLVMEYVEGETLGDVLARGPVEPARAVTLVRGVAEALDHAHANGIVHRDIKPGNVLLAKDGSVKVADLGIAKAVERTEITGTGTVLGTPSYMAPEQLDGGKAGPAVDIYALATMAFEMLTGKKARRGRTAVEIAHQVVNEDAPEACDVNPALPRAAGEVLKAGMAKDPAQRPESAGELAERLETALDARAERARPVAHPPAPPATMRRPPTPRPIHTAGTPRWVLAVLGLFAVAIAAVVIGLTSGGGDQASDRAAAPSAPAKEKDRPTHQEESPAPAAEQPATEAPAPVAGVPQPKGKGSISEAHALQSQGYNALAGGDYKNAIKLSKRSIEAFPPGTSDLQYAYALFNLGKALRLDGHPEQAIPVLEARLEIPNQTETVQRELDLARSEAGAQ